MADTTNLSQDYDYSGMRFADIEPKLQALIQKNKPDVAADDFFRFNEILDYRLQLIADELEADEANADDINKEIIDSIRQGEFITTTKNKLPPPTFGQRMADQIARFGGSWGFILIFMCIILVWMALNITGLLFPPYDPYPFILLNLVLSCLAAIQAPIIMMSQNRQAEHDRQESDNDYAVNLKAEIEIRLLHQKMDHLLHDQMKHFQEIQALQTSLLDKLHVEVDKLKQEQRDTQNPRT